MTLKLAVKKQVVLDLKYFPNKDGNQRVGWRTVLPLDLYTYRNVNYLLGWQSEGASVTGGSGYRLFFTRNIQDYKETDTTVQQPFALNMAMVRQSNAFQIKAWWMIKMKQIE